MARHARPLSWLLIALAWLAALALVVGTFRAIPSDDLLAVLGRLGVAQVAAWLAVNAAIAGSFGLRWRIILRAQGHAVPYPALAGYRLAAYSISYFTPGPHLGGEPLQAFLLQRRHGVPGAVAVSSVALDKLIEALANSSFLALGVAVVGATQFSAGLSIPALALSGLFLVAIPVIIMIAWSRGRAPISDALARVLPPAWRARSKLYGLIAASEKRAADLCQTRPDALRHAFGVSLLIWIALFGEYWLAARFLGVELSVVDLIVAMTAARIAILLPFPGGLGALGASQALAMAALGHRPALGLSLSLLMHARDLLFGALGLIWGGLAAGGWNALWRKKMDDPATRKMESARLPTRYGEFTLSLYQTQTDRKDHLALVMGDVAGRPNVLARVHSECLTGDVLGSRRCDCGEQLDLAMHIIAREGAGVIVYLRQEGRGIGLLDKLRAYNLQDQGYDTVDANLILGHQADEREYTAAADILRDLGVQSVRLLTNNLNKVESLEALGIPITDRLPLEAPANPENAGYLETKAKRLNHALTLSQASRGGNGTTLRPSDPS